MRHFLTAFLVLALAGGCTPEWDPARRQVAAANPTGPAIVRDAVMPRPAPRSPAGFAGAPDRGVLLGYDTSRNVAQSGGYTSYPVDLSEAHAFRAISTGEMNVFAPDGSTIRLRYERHVEHPDGNWSWIGRDAEGNDAVVTFGEKAVFGSIPYEGHPALRITHASGRSWLVATDPRMVADGAVPRSGKQDYLVPPDVVQAVGAQKQSAATVPAMAQMGSTVVDVVLGYTNGFATSLGGPSQAVTRLTNMVDITNQAYANSQIVAQVRLTGTVQVNYPDATSNETALEELTGYRSGSIPVPSALLPLRAAREQFGGDLVSLVRKFRTPENQGCGIAWLLGGGSTPIDQSDAPFAYSIVSDGSDVDESDSKTYFCREETLAHEFGHNMGQAHNPEDSTSTGAHPYAYGYREASSTGFYTVMAYRLKDSSQFTIRFFSNPLVSYQGRPTGTSNADNARSLAQTTPLIASFLGSVSAPSSYRRNDVNADGKSDLLWSQPGSNLFAHWLMNGAMIAGSASYAIDNVFEAIGSGDLDGNGYADVVWRNRVNDQVWVWLRTPTGYTNQYILTLSSSWKLLGTGDINGDGRSDLLWSQPGSSLFVHWAMNGATITSSASYLIDSAFDGIGSGDLDGNGYADVIWRSRSNGQVWVWLRTPTGYTSQYITTLSPSWILLGTGDVNADGRSDLLWSQPGASLFVHWIMNGATITASAAYLIDSAFHAIASGDFDGNGRADVVWRNNRGQIYVWLGSTTGYTTHFIYTLTGWSAIP